MGRKEKKIVTVTEPDGVLNFRMYASIAVDISSRGIDRLFTYGIPEEMARLVSTGSVVRVPFRGREVTGYVQDISEKPAGVRSGVRILSISGVSAPETLWDEEMLELARWMESYYACSYLSALKVLIPGPVRADSGGKIPSAPTEKVVRLTGEPADILERIGNRAGSRIKVIKFLEETGGSASLPKIIEKTGAGREIFKKLAESGFIELIDEMKLPRIDELKQAPCFDGVGIKNLTADQRGVYEKLLERLESGKGEIALLHGVTGSGKTEVYLQVIQKALDMGREVLVLVPEISLTPQAIERFHCRFGEQVAVLHSRLTGAQRRNMWWNIRKKNVKVVLGARSAVFAPMENIGVIVVDEEHDSSYKQESEPRYNARQVAIWRGIRHKALVILGSATPSMESYYWASVKKKYDLLTLNKRIGDTPLPEIILTNPAKDAKDKNCVNRGEMIGHLLKEEMVNTINKGEQIILFLNRRAYSAFLLCRECGNVIRCPYCDVTLSYHREQFTLKCHYCDYERKAPSKCPFCGGYSIYPVAMGIQKVEEELREIFPGAGIIRMDRDTTSGRHSHRDLISRFARGEADILLGTQMIAKGHDFPGVTLVGVVLADISLYFPDFRSLENTYQILTQVAGRAGRRDTRGRVIIQTFNPDTPVIKAVVAQDYEGFFRWELKNRQALNYPPSSHIVNLIFQGGRDEEVRETALIFAETLRNKKKFSGVFKSVLGPAPCFISRIKEKYRWHVMLKGDSVGRIVAVLKAVKGYMRIPKNINLIIDVDPMSTM